MPYLKYEIFTLYRLHCIKQINFKNAPNKELEYWEK